MLPDDTLLEDLKLSTRTHHCLTTHAGLKTVGQVRAMADRDLLQLPNFGKKSLAEIRQVIGDTKAIYRLFDQFTEREIVGFVMTLTGGSANPNVVYGQIERVKSVRAAMKNEAKT